MFVQPSMVIVIVCRNPTEIIKFRDDRLNDAASEATPSIMQPSPHTA